MRAPDHGDADDTGDKGADILDDTKDDGVDKTDDKGGADKTILGGAEDDKSQDDKDKTDAKGGADKAEPNPLLGAPEGDYEITGLPEGTEIDKVALDALAPIAKEIGLSNEGMSKLALAYNDQILPHVTATLEKHVETQRAEIARLWDAETRTEIEGGKDKDGKPIEPAKGEDDKPIYGGMAYADVRKVAAKAIDRFAGPEFREFVEESGLGNHPALVRFAFRVGRAISEDTFERGDGGGKKLTSEEKFYGSN